MRYWSYVRPPPTSITGVNSVTVERISSVMVTKSVFTGVDYVRLTADQHDVLGRWEDIVLPEYVAEERAGRKPHMRWILGYYGRVGEHCFVGARDDGCMIQLSGALAWHRWYDASNHSGKCTRMDLQVTRPVNDEPGLYIRTMYEIGKAAAKRPGRPQELTLTDTPSGAKMLTVGSRQSMLYGRMYDKGRESGLDEYQGCVRWEVEVKGQSAIDLCAWMRQNKSEPYVCQSMVRNFYEERGMPPTWEDLLQEDVPPPVKRTRTDQTKIAWLAAQVAPTLQTLKEHGRLPDAIRALFGVDLTEAQVQGILALVEIDRGD